MSGIGADDNRGIPPRWDVGDRVITTRRLGGLLRPRVRAGTPGIIIARGVDDRYAVAFSDDTIEQVAGGDLTTPL